MKVIEVNVSDEVFGVLGTIRSDRNKFVAAALREKIEREKQRSLLAEGYKATYSEDLAISREFRFDDAGT